MIIFKLFSLLVLLVITFYTTVRYTHILTQTRRNKIIVYSFIFGFQILFILRFFSDYTFQSNLMKTLILFGTSVFFFFVYLSFLFFITIDIISFIKKKRNKEMRIIRRRIAAGCMVLSIILGVYTNMHAKQIGITTYTYHVDKKSSLDELNIAYISDIHLGTSVNEDELKKIVEKTNDMKPDVILLGGDIFDENTTDDDLEMSIPYLSKLKSTYGVYYIYGNHEFYSDTQNRYEDVLNKADITILNDESALIDNIAIIGRLDVRRNSNRESMDELAKEYNDDNIIIVLDHQPIVDDSEGIDLQLSGHTHNGQIFPMNLLVPVQYSHNYGFYERPYPMVVSSGAGTWGIPSRLFTDSEIVNITLTFN
ncbi:metallophosphoesterase [Breznakia pachnodae]|uniref:MPP superfamily phosphohydrolase n=1 Tax=Breznakia pachnodae TaxID=265178 RepID=A0ABU0E5U2_9FIRM|nr:metallophosphoesterase [Breznakia pachnodae]MDQ0362186.1 putative MPP superfamily phosphohydrolase [Breznakia pachnodae]